MAELKELTAYQLIIYRSLDLLAGLVKSADPARGKLRLKGCESRAYCLGKALY